MPKVSVIIPCYNLGQYLDEAVDSVLAQTFQDFEIIIVNDGSTDEFTNKLLANYIKPKTRVLTTDNQGLPSARNNGIKTSKGEYICCLDADDKYHSDFLEKTVEVLNKDIEHGYGIVTTWLYTFGEANGICKSLDFNPYRLAMKNCVHVASIFRKECWEKKDGYSTNLSGYQDWDFWLSIVAMGYKWFCINEPLFYYRRRPHSMIKESDKNKITLYKQIIRNNIGFYADNCEPILAEFMEFTNDYDQLKKHYQELNQSMKGILNSYSWRVTAPLRILYRHLSRLRKAI